jgi:hypothetical protein
MGKLYTLSTPFIYIDFVLPPGFDMASKIVILIFGFFLNIKLAAVRPDKSA